MDRWYRMNDMLLAMISEKVRDLTNDVENLKEEIYNIKHTEAIPIKWLRENKKMLLEHLEVCEDKIEELIECWEEDNE